MPYWADQLTDDVDASASFYREVLGWEVSSADNNGDYRIGRVEGLPISGFIPQDAQAAMPNTWVTYFLSRDIEKDLEKAEKLGGKAMSVPQDVARGTMAVVADPVGGVFGLLQPPAGEQFVAGGEPGCPVWHELTVTHDFQQALDFYGRLFDWELHTTDEYATAEEEGAAFAGLWNAEGVVPTGGMVFWQSYLGVRDIAKAAAAVERLGGEVVRGPAESPFGPVCLVRDPVGAAVTLAEVPEPPEEEPRESDDVLGG